MRMGQGVRTGLGHGGITCILQTQFSSFFLFWSGGYDWSRGRGKVLGRGGFVPHFQ